MPIERKLAAIMFTDIAGYTALSSKDSTKVSELLKTQRESLKNIKGTKQKSINMKKLL